MYQLICIFKKFINYCFKTTFAVYVFILYKYYIINFNKNQYPFLLFHRSIGGCGVASQIL